MALKPKVERMLCQESVHWVACHPVDGKHMGILDFDEIEFEGKDIVVLDDEEEGGLRCQ